MTAELDAHLTVRRPGFTLDITLTASVGEVIALLGPNGAGKTTALRALAGLTPLSDGHIRLGGEAVHTLRTEQRPIGMVFQDYLLFPHLTALDNVAFGLRCAGVRKAEARRQATQWLARVGLTGSGKPRTLSGGQAQRVALARALALSPRLLLLDEPLAALDAHTRLEIRAQLRRHLSEFKGVTVLVTHDPLEAMALADRLVVVEDGRIVQEGTPARVAREPHTDYVARLVGLNLYRGKATADGVTIDGTDLVFAAHAVGPVFVAFAPTAVTLSCDRRLDGPSWESTVAGVESHGDRVRVHLDAPLRTFADVTAAALAELDLTPGQQVWVTVHAGEFHVY